MTSTVCVFIFIKSEVAQLSRLGIVNVEGVMEKEEEGDEMEEEQMVTSGLSLLIIMIR